MNNRLNTAFEEAMLYRRNHYTFYSHEIISKLNKDLSTILITTAAQHFSEASTKLPHEIKLGEGAIVAVLTTLCKRYLKN